MPDIFLSYNREDQAVARHFAEGFERAGYSVWWDVTLRSGDAYDEVTEQALRNAKAVVVLWSKKSVVSRWVRAEATLADRNRTLVPAMIEVCERPIMFELTQTAELGHWQGDGNDATWQAFVGDVRKIIGTAPAVPPAASANNPPALTISAPARNKDFRPSLAILPFTNRSGVQADDVFADGMVEDLISALTLGGELKVIAQSATLGYRKNVSDLRSIGQQLDVRYLLEGNVRRVGQTLRVTAQLVQADNGAILWLQKFDRPLTELAGLQEQLVTEVANHLGVQVMRVEMEKALAKPGNLSAWEAVMRAMSLFTINRESFRPCIVDARKAVALAPDYALAHAVLAYLQANMNWIEFASKDAAITLESRRHSERALTLGANDPTVLSWVAMAQGISNSWPEALRCAQRALALNPNLLQTHQTLAMAYLWHDQPDKVIEHCNIALLLAPRGFQTYLSLSYRALGYLAAGKTDLALQSNEQVLQLNPGWYFGWKDRAIICAKLGRHAEATAAIRQMRNIDNFFTLAELEAHHNSGFFSPKFGSEQNVILHKLWLETPMEPSA